MSGISEIYMNLILTHQLRVSLLTLIPSVHFLVCVLTSQFFPVCWGDIDGTSVLHQISLIPAADPKSLSHLAPHKREPKWHKLADLMGKI